MPRRRKMGLVHADLTLRGPGGEVKLTRILVDTGSSYTGVPETLARRLGAREREIIPLELADGSVVHRMLAEIEVEILHRRGTRFIVFGHEKDSTLIGVDTLEGLRLEIDPVRHRLRLAATALAVSSRPGPEPAPA